MTWNLCCHSQAWRAAGAAAAGAAAAGAPAARAAPGAAAAAARAGAAAAPCRRALLLPVFVERAAWRMLPISCRTFLNL